MSEAQKKPVTVEECQAQIKDIFEQMSVEQRKEYLRQLEEEIDMGKSSLEPSQSKEAKTFVGRLKKVMRGDRRVVGWTRFFALIPFVGLFVSAAVMTIMALVNTFEVSYEAATGHVGIQQLVVDYIELADIYLLAIVLYIMALGVFSLFVSDKIPLPSWLEIHDLDDLKEKLVSVVGVVLGVFFLGRVINGAAAMDTLFMGLGIAAIIIALAFFVEHVMKSH